MTKKPAPAARGTKLQPENQNNSDHLKLELERQVGPLISGAQRQQVLTRVLNIVASERFSGPIAHPRHLREYDEIVPGSAERIIRMAERAQEHNIAMETKIIEGELFAGRYGMTLGFILFLILIAAGFFAGMNDNNILAGILLSAAAISGGVVAFIKGRSG